MDRHIEHLAPDYSKTKRWNQISCGIMMNELATLWSEEKVDLMAYFLKLFCFWWYFFNNKEQFYVKTILNKMETFLLCGVAVFFFFSKSMLKSISSKLQIFNKRNSLESQVLETRQFHLQREQRHWEHRGIQLSICFTGLKNSLYFFLFSIIVCMHVQINIF